MTYKHEKSIGLCDIHNNGFRVEILPVYAQLEGDRVRRWHTCLSCADKVLGVCDIQGRDIPVIRLTDWEGDLI